MTEGTIGKLAKGYSIADIAKMKGVTVAYAESQLRDGAAVEMEHTDNAAIAEAIAKDHLFEDIHYYKKLKEMEATTYEVGGNYRMPNRFGGFTTIKVMPVDENLKNSKDKFSVLVTVRVKKENGDMTVQKKPLRTYPINEYNEFIDDLLGRGAEKYEVGGKVVSKGGNHPDDATKGGYFKGRPHSQGGIKAINMSNNQAIEVEGGEVIITKPAVDDDTKREFEGEMLTNREILSRINQSGGGVPIFSDGGDIASPVCGCSGKMYNYGGKMMSDSDIVYDIASKDYRTEIEKKQDEYRALDSQAYKEGGAIGYYLNNIEKNIFKKFKSGGLLKQTIGRQHEDSISRIKSDGYVYTVPANNATCLDVYITEHGLNMLKDHDDMFFATDTDPDCGCSHKEYKGGGQTEGVVFKKVKIKYNTGDEVVTSVNPAVSDEEIEKYFKVASKVNISAGPEDKMATIESVEIIHDVAGSNYKYFKGVSAKYKNQFEVNKAVEELVDNIDAKNMSPEERAFLLYYSGYGGLEKYGATGKGLLYEYFTPSAIALKMWGLAYKYGFKGGKVLEPSCGIGEFIKYAPEQQLVTGFEINPYSARICKILYPLADIKQKEFETNFIKNNNSIRGNTQNLDKYSLVIGNPPYGSMGGIYAGMGEKSYTNSNNYIDYFITRGLDLLEKDGLLIYIIGTEVAAGGVPFLQQKSSAVKKDIAKKAILLDAYRLPNGLFEQTDVVTDIIVLQKI